MAWATILEEAADVVLLQECSYGFLMSFIMLAKHLGDNYEFMTSFGTKLKVDAIVREPLGVAIVWKRSRFKERTPSVQLEALKVYEPWVETKWKEHVKKYRVSGHGWQKWAYGAWAMADHLTCVCKKTGVPKSCKHGHAQEASTLGGLLNASPSLLPGLCMEGVVKGDQGGVDYMAAVSTQVGDDESMKRLLAITLSFAE